MKSIRLLVLVVALLVLLIFAFEISGVQYHHRSPIVPLPVSTAEATEDLLSSYLAYVAEIIDGDSIHVYVSVWPGIMVKAHIRLFGIDTPEIRKAKCPQEKELCLQASARLKELLKVGPIRLRVVEAKDKYWRVLAAVYAHDGTDIAKKLTDEGLAHAYDGKSKRQSWCENE